MRRLAAASLGLLFYSTCLAGSWVSGAAEGVAIQGYDAVAYFTQKAPVKGSAQFSHEHGGTVWFFNSAENRDLFAASPGSIYRNTAGTARWRSPVENPPRDPAKPGPCATASFTSMPTKTCRPSG
jgi:hypothetical protein